MPSRGRPAASSALLDRVVAWEWDAAADRVVASPSLLGVYGVPAIEGVSRGFALVHPDDCLPHEARVHAAVDRRRGYRSSFRILNPATSKVVWIEERAEAIDRGTVEPPQLIGLAFDVSARQDGSTPGADVDAMDALREYGDVLLRVHAGVLRKSSRRKEPAIGEWITAATSAFEGLGRQLTAASDAAQVINAETIALRPPRRA